MGGASAPPTTTMTFTEFKTMVAAFMQRSEAEFTVGGVDLLARAIHQAKLWAQRQRDFEMARIEAVVKDVDGTDGADITTAVLASDLVTPVSIKTIKKAFLPLTDGSALRPVEVITRDSHVQRLYRHYENITSLDPDEVPSTQDINYFAVVRFANKIYVTPYDEDTWGGTKIDVSLDAIRWMPEYSTSVTSDFFLDFCEDWMLHRTVLQLNMMLKEDMRVPVSRDMLNDTWHSMLAWDSQLIYNSAEDASLE